MRDNSFVCYNVCQLNLCGENKGIRRIMVASGGGGGGLIKAILVVAIKLVDGGREMRWFYSRAQLPRCFIKPVAHVKRRRTGDETCREIYTRVPAILDIWQW